MKTLNKEHPHKYNLGGVLEERREHYLCGWLSYNDRKYATAWHVEDLVNRIPAQKLIGFLWELRDFWLPRIMEELNHQKYPQDAYRKRMRERVKALLLDAAKRLDNTYNYKPLRKTIKKSDFAPADINWKKQWWGLACEGWIKTAFFRWSFSVVTCAGEHLADILIAAAWGRFSPEAEKFIAYHLWLMAETIEL